MSQQMTVYDYLNGLGEEAETNAWVLIALAGQLGGMGNLMAYFFSTKSVELLNRWEKEEKLTLVEMNQLRKLSQQIHQNLEERGISAAREYKELTPLAEEIMTPKEILALAVPNAKPKSSVNRLFEIENQLTMIDGERHPGAYEAYNAIYLEYAVPGLEKIIAAGYDTPEKLYVLWNDTYHRSVPMIASAFKFDD
jgi:hypothetical protein